MAFFVLLSSSVSGPFMFPDNAGVELVGKLKVKKCRIILSRHHCNVYKLALYISYIENYTFLSDYNAG